MSGCPRLTVINRLTLESQMSPIHNRPSVLSRMPLLLIACVLLSSCDRPAEHTWFRETDGIVVGEPLAFGHYWVLPVIFVERGLNSAVWVGGATTRIVGSNIYVTAKLTMPKRTPSYYGNHLELGYLKDGRYQLIYVDPDGSEIPVKEITIQNTWTEEEEKIRKANEEFQKKVHYR